MLEEGRYANLTRAFRVCEDAYNIDSKKITEKIERKKSLLQETLDELFKLGYSRRDLYVALDIEPLTFDRWQGGNVSMKPDTFREFKRLVEEVINDRSQRLINISDTGFLSWRYVFENRQMKARRIWYVTEGKFLLERSLDVKRSVSNLFSKDREGTEGYHEPVLIYLYRINGPTQSSLVTWYNNLVSTGEIKEFRGTVIGIGADLPWFQPGIRTMILEIDPLFAGGGVQLEAYLRIKLAQPFEGKVLQALGLPANDHPTHIQWLSVRADTITEWWTVINIHYSNLVNQLMASKTVDFDVFIRQMTSDGSDPIVIDPATGEQVPPRK